MKSTRLKNKALLDLCGYSMTEQLVRRLKLSKYIDEIVICTSNLNEDAVLLSKSKEWNVKSYAGHKDDVLSRMVNVSEIYSADAVIRVTGDNPFTDNKNIDKMIERHFESLAEYTRTNNLPLGVTAEVMSKDMLKKLQKNIQNTNDSEYMSFFAFDPNIYHCEVLEAKRSQKRPFYSLTVDYPEDLELARTIFKSLSIEGSIPSIDDIVAFLDKSNQAKIIDKEAIIKTPYGENITYSDLIQGLDRKAIVSREKVF